MREHLRQFSLSDDPFTKDVEDEELWLPPSKQIVVDEIVEAVHERHSVVLAGEPGIGKTCVTRAVRGALDSAVFRFTYCHNVIVGRRDFYRQLCVALGLAKALTSGSQRTQTGKGQFTQKPKPPTATSSTREIRGIWSGTRFAKSLRQIPADFGSHQHPNDLHEPALPLAPGWRVRLAIKPIEPVSESCEPHSTSVAELALRQTAPLELAHDSRPIVPTPPNATLLLAHAPSIASATRTGETSPAERLVRRDKPAGR